MPKTEPNRDHIHKNMTHNGESFNIMEAITTSFRKRKSIIISKCCALILCCAFLVSLVATGLIVYSAVSCESADRNIVRILENPSSRKSSPVRETEPTTSKTTTTLDSLTSSIEISTLFTTISPTSIQTTSKTDGLTSRQLDVRLPKDVVPRSYEIKLIPYMLEGNFTFQGEVSILLNIIYDTYSITLHSDDLVVRNVLVYSAVNKPYRNEKNIPVKIVNFDRKRQFVIIELNEKLQAGIEYYLEIQYTGELKDVLQGIYRSSYTANNKTWWIAATQFQPTDARRAFPCFDEPALKARFKISIARPRNMNSISNMPKLGSKSDIVVGMPGYEWDHFEESLPMSTYLVAFVISNFEKISDGNFSVWARKEALLQARYSLEIGPKILRFYENYFKIKFPLPKIDMIALPDFSAGAMENWGLITYRETAMLYLEGVSDKATLQRVATVISHELAHQWFGNLVTPKWWTDLWLNEGFASYMEYIGTNAIYPEWNVLDQFVVYELQSVFSLDALKSSHEISVEVNNPTEINDIFDRISYAKGATIIRMMDNFLTTEVFQRGLTKYLKARLFGNAEQDDLWAALTLEAHESKVLDLNTTVKEIMDTWTLQTGFPIVTVERDYKNKRFTCKQRRFFIDNRLYSNDTSNGSKWWIPLTYEYKTDDVMRSAWLRAEPEIVLKDKYPEDWLLVNVNQTGYYRVNYDKRNWELLLSQLMNEKEYVKIPTANRAQILDDVMNLAVSGDLDYDLALNITVYLKHEKDYVPWKAALTALEYIEEMVIRTADFEHYKNYMLDLTEKLYHEIGFKEKPTDSQLTIYTRFALLWRVCLLGNLDCVRNAVIQFQNWRMSPDPDRHNPISPNIKSLVYCTAIRVGGQEEWDFAWKRYAASEVGSDKEILLTALGCSREIWLLSRYLHWAVTENSGIRKQDSARVFSAVANNPVGQDLAFRFLKENWLKIRDYVGSSIMLLNAIIRSCTSKSSTRLEIEEMERFAKIMEEDVVTRTIQQAIEQAEANVNWKKRNFEKIVKWLKNYSGNVHANRT
ncbi:aminopeptidase N [Agrilus planipennis]|uniref:Aminopeptidase N n=1 Tax=Agrilus planipennis TaxID=224129 RepID=A0A7F5R8J9_AGRPL|nr:aminopeptidase N [Agrilus planipennis]